MTIDDKKLKRQLLGDEYLHDASIISRRVVISFIIAFVLMLVLLARVFYLQSIQYNKFSTLSQDNRIEIVPVLPIRGQIYDDKGVLLGRNVAIFSIKIVPEQVKNYDELFTRLSTIIDFDPKDVERFHRARRRQSSFDEVMFLDNLDDKAIAKFSVRQYLFPGVYLRGDLKRYYDYGYETAHVVGYVGRVSERDLASLEEEKYKKLSYIGKSGIERSYEDVMVGELGFRQSETNVYGKNLRNLDESQAPAGKDLHLSIDLELQKKAIEALGDEVGSVVAMNPKNGNVMVFASTPSYDPNLFVQGISQKNYEALRDDPNKPLINRSINGRYAPGSTIKPMMGLAVLSKGKSASDSVYCQGFYSLPGSSHRYRCWKRTGHGRVDLKEAIMHSCDVYFYQAALDLGIDYMHDYLDNFGLGKQTGIDLIGESAGILPNQEWKETSLGKPWYKGETIIAGIGQGYMLATPLQLAVATAVVVNKGKYVVPRLVQGYGVPGSTDYEPLKTKILETQLDDLNGARNDQMFQTVIEAMKDVVHHPRGTARRIKSESYSIAGKTGTAQVVAIAQGAKYDASALQKKFHDHALFIGFAPIDDPEIVVATIVENGGSGSGVAAPVVKQVMDAYFFNKFTDDELPELFEIAPEEVELPEIDLPEDALQENESSGETSPSIEIPTRTPTTTPINSAMTNEGLESYDSFVNASIHQHDENDPHHNHDHNLE